MNGIKNGNDSGHRGSLGNYKHWSELKQNGGESHTLTRLLKIKYIIINSNKKFLNIVWEESLFVVVVCCLLFFHKNYF